MGKLFVNGTTITKPFVLNGKKVVKITIDGKEAIFSNIPTVELDYTYQGIHLNPSVRGLIDIEFITRTFIAGEFTKTMALPKAIILGTSAFPSTDITSLILPKATSIGNNAFGNSDKLTSIELPRVVTINGGAFSYCNISTLLLPEAITVGSTSFYQCSQLTSVLLPKATYIGSEAFRYGSKITKISMPNATTIGDNAFANINHSDPVVVILKNTFNSTAEKNRIFGTGNWSNITFQWV